MKKVTLSCIVLIIAFTAMYAVPYSTIGLLRVPDAYILPNKAAEITLTNYFRGFQDINYAPNNDLKYVPMGKISIGILNRVELAAWGGDGLGFANVKVKLIEETTAIPQVAVGIDNLLSPVREEATKILPSEEFSDNPDRCYYEKNSPYFTVSKSSIIKGLPGIPMLETVLSAGMGRNKFRGQVPFAHKWEGVFVSLNVKPYKNLTIVAENDGHNVNFGAQYFYKNFTVKASVITIEELVDDQRLRFGLGLSYLFDKYADARQRPVLFMDENGNVVGQKSTSETVVTPQKGGPASNNDLLDELKKLREQREQAQKVLEELKNQLKEMEAETDTDTGR
jgi:hypothetical protein